MMPQEMDATVQEGLKPLVNLMDNNGFTGLGGCSKPIGGK